MVGYTGVNKPFTGRGNRIQLGNKGLRGNKVTMVRTGRLSQKGMGREFIRIVHDIRLVPASPSTVTPFVTDLTSLKRSTRWVTSRFGKRPGRGRSLIGIRSIIRPGRGR